MNIHTRGKNKTELYQISVQFRINNNYYGKIANWLFLVFADLLDMVVDTYLDFGESLLWMLLEVVV